MIKQLTKIGNSMGIIIERPILELLRIDGDTPLDVRTDGEGLIIQPVRQSNRAKRVRAAAERAATTHAGAFKKLAR